jgi:hypothetical protein
MGGAMYIPRRIEGTLTRHLQRGKSILLLGPRQTRTMALRRARIAPRVEALPWQDLPSIVEP